MFFRNISNEIDSKYFPFKRLFSLQYIFFFIISSLFEKNNQNGSNNEWLTESIKVSNFFRPYKSHIHLEIYAWYSDCYYFLSQFFQSFFYKHKKRQKVIEPFNIRSLNIFLITQLLKVKEFQLQTAKFLTWVVSSNCNYSRNYRRNQIKYNFNWEIFNFVKIYNPFELFRFFKEMIVCKKHRFLSIPWNFMKISFFGASSICSQIKTMNPKWKL
jgi:hypothetical protein